MSINLDNKFSLKSHPDTHHIDDSFDSEFSLLESTLTNENDDPHVGGKSMSADTLNKLNIIIRDPSAVQNSCKKSCESEDSSHREINEYIELPTQPLQSTISNVSQNLYCKNNVPEDILSEARLILSSPNETSVCVKDELKTIYDSPNASPSNVLNQNCNTIFNSPIVPRGENYFEECKEIENEDLLLEDENAPITDVLKNNPTELHYFNDDTELSCVTRQMTNVEMLNTNDQAILEVDASPISPEAKETEIHCSPHAKPVPEEGTDQGLLSDGDKVSVVDIKENYRLQYNSYEDNSRHIVVESDIGLTNKCVKMKDLDSCSQPIEHCEGLTVVNNSNHNEPASCYEPERVSIAGKDNDTCGKIEVSNTSIVCSSSPLGSKQSGINQLPTFDSNITEIDSNGFEKAEIKTSFYCSTPVTKSCVTDQRQTPKLGGFDDSEIISSFNKSCLNKKLDLKRKKISLDCIEELEEDESDIGVCDNKKPKFDRIEESSKITNDENPASTSIPVYEAPAKSILKKWQPSYLSRNAAPYLILDECGESDDEGSKQTDTPIEQVDDFEDACKSLTEELNKCSQNMETLEKYHSQLQLENKMDDDKFDELLQEVISSYDVDDDLTSLTLKSMEESLDDADKTLIAKLIAEHGGSRTKNQEVENGTLSKLDTIVELQEEGDLLKQDISNEQHYKLDEQKIGAENVTNTVSETDNSAAQQSREEKQELKQKDDEVDEEDKLLDQKAYEFVEYVSNDPKENEDNYNPEWQKLGCLTTDDERYKAVRDRWRSLVPPDPHKDLTYRQWRQKNKKDTVLSNNNSIWNPADMHKQYQESERTLYCTTIFDNKIKKLVHEIEQSRREILRQRERDFELLAKKQDEAQRHLINRRCHGFLALLHKQHIEECRNLKNLHDQEIKRITAINEEKIRVLKKASEEVVWFQQFYKGVGDESDEVCLYMTEEQVQELQETEDLLDSYSTMYYRR